MIPKIIHYCWFGKQSKSAQILKYIESWKKFCPDYKIVEWNENNFDLQCNAYVKEAYEAEKWAFVTDYVRLYALYNYGGVYMDTDVELIKNIDYFLRYTAFSGFEQEKQISTAIMGSEIHGEWIGYLLTYYKGRHFKLSDGSLDCTTNVDIITNMTCVKYPISLDNKYQEINNVLTLFPKEFFCPKNYKTNEILLTENTVCIHHFNASWHSKKEKKQRKEQLNRINKKKYFIKKYGEKSGLKKYLKWEKRRVVYFGLFKSGWKASVKSAIKLLPKICFHVFGNNIILLESAKPLEGNTGALYRYILSQGNGKKYYFIWISKDEIKNHKYKNKRTYIFDQKSNSMLKNFFLYSAKYIFYDNEPIWKRHDKQISVYLTHGCPPLKNVKGIIKVPMQTDYALCTSEKMKALVSEQYDIPVKKFFISGLPRNDSLFTENNELEKLLRRKNYNKVIIWMPTFRKSKYEDRNDSRKEMKLGIPLFENNEQFDQLNDKLLENKTFLIIKLHPGQDVSVVKVSSKSNIMLLANEKIQRLGINSYSLMAETDALLTDFSSVAFDYLLLDKPIGYVVDDMEDYKLGFAFKDPYSMMPGQKIKTKRELYGFIENLSNGKDEFKEARSIVRNLTNDFQDRNNAKRVAEYFHL